MANHEVSQFATIKVIRDMKTWSIIVVATLIALISTVSAQNPLDAVAGSLQDQVNSAGSQLQQKAAQHALEGNLTQAHIAQDINAAKENLKGQAAEKINQNLNLTAEQLQQKAKEELQNQVNQRAKQPGFEAFLAIVGILAIALLMRRF
jgi:PGF-CTERM protein